MAKAPGSKAPARKTPAKRSRRKPESDVVFEWERQPGEGARAFQAFAVYRDMGAERSTAKVARELGKTKAIVDRWSGDHEWVARAAAWDLELDRRAQAELADARVEAARRHAAIAARSLEALQVPIEELLRRAEKNPKAIQDEKKVPLSALLNFVRAYARTAPAVVVSERLSLGISTENVGGHDGGPLVTPEDRARSMSDDELDAFLLGADAQRRAGEAG